MHNNILIYSEIGVCPNCHQKGFIQHLLEADAETHNQTLGHAQGILLKRGRKACTSQRGQGYHKKTQRIN